MRWRSRRVLVPMACAVILVLFVAGLGLIRLVSAPTPTVTWQVTSASFSPQDQSQIVAQLQKALAAGNQNPKAPTRYAIMAAQRQGDQAILGAAALPGDGLASAAAEPLFVIARRQNSAWAVWIPSSPEFCAQLNQLPSSLISRDERDQFIGCSS